MLKTGKHEDHITSTYAPHIHLMTCNAAHATPWSGISNAYVRITDPSSWTVWCAQTRGPICRS